jgi:hypothetical protein
MKYFEKVALSPSFLLHAANRAQTKANQSIIQANLEKYQKYQKQYWKFLEGALKREKGTKK